MTGPFKDREPLGTYPSRSDVATSEMAASMRSAYENRWFKPIVLEYFNNTLGQEYPVSGDELAALRRA